MTVTLSPEQQAIVDADLAGPRLVDAGAGTGKTFTIVQRAVALIRSGKLRANEMLVVTFTKAAATEIAGRLEAELDSGTERPTCGTFHGVAGDLLREFAYDAGSSPDARAIDDGRARGIFARAFGDLTAGRLDVDLAAFPLLDRPKALERSLAAMALSMKQRGDDMSTVIQRARAAVTELETIAFGGVKELKRNGQPRSSWPRPDPERSAAERLHEAARERTNINVVAALLAHFQTLLDAEHLLTFGDILVRATRMLRERPTIAAALRARWKHAIVDEFQDTNETQIAFLEALCGDDLRPVLVVGDVRQAIYEFNGARPQGIIDFRVRACEKLPLTINRRSLQPILDVAKHTLDALAGMDPELNAALAAQRGDADPRCVRLKLFDGDRALGREAAHVADALRDLVDMGVSARDCAVLLRTRTRADAYARAIRERGLAVQLYGGVGFFDAPEIREVVAWLRLADDPSDAFAVTAALQSAAIGMTDGGVAWLATGGALAHAALAHAFQAHAALTTPPDGGASAEVASADVSPADEPLTDLLPAEWERLERFRRTARIVCSLTDRPLVEAVRTVIVASGAEIARADNTTALVQVRANLDKLVRFAADFAADRPLARISDLVAELRERDELELDLPIAEVEGDRVAMMTIHGAKGLEWRHVFLVDVGASFPLNNSDAREKVAQFDSATGALALKHGIDGRPTLRWFLSEYEHDAAGILVKSKSAASAEEFRLLYVALTRAKDAVYVTGRKTRSNSISGCFRAVENWAREVSGDPAHHHFGRSNNSVRELETAVAAHDERDITHRLAARIERATLAWQGLVERPGSLSYTAMALHERCPRQARYRYLFALPTLGDDAPVGQPLVESTARSERDPARYGRVVHRTLELMARARIARLNLDADDALAQAFATEDRTPRDDERSRARGAVDRALMSLRAITPVDAERAFEVRVDGVPLSGFIDLIARDQIGTPVIVDYKTGRTAAEYYALQFGLYAYAVRAEFPNPRAAILRIGDDAATFESVVPASEVELRRAVARANLMEQDEPRPGSHCGFCPYAGAVCNAAVATAPRTNEV